MRPLTNRLSSLRLFGERVLAHEVFGEGFAASCTAPARDLGDDFFRGLAGVQNGTGEFSGAGFQPFQAGFVRAEAPLLVFPFGVFALVGTGCDLHRERGNLWKADGGCRICVVCHGGCHCVHAFFGASNFPALLIFLGFWFFDFGKCARPLVWEILCA